MRITLTGAAGAVGSVLAPFLVAKGHQLLPLTRQNHPIPSLDWFDPANPPDALIHLAVASHARDPGSPKDLAAPHLSFLEGLIAKGWRGHLIFFSSAAVYAGGPQPLTENAPLVPPNPYGAAKLALETGFRALAETFGLNLTILRPANIYGTPDDLRRRRVIALLIEAARQGSPFTLYGDGSSQRDYLYIDDLCGAVQAVLERPGAAGEVFNLASGRGTALADLIAMVERAMGLPIQRQILPPQAEAEAAILNPARARDVLGWKAQMPLDEGIARLIRILP